MWDWFRRLLEGIGGTAGAPVPGSARGPGPAGGELRVCFDAVQVSLADMQCSDTARADVIVVPAAWHRRVAMAVALVEALGRSGACATVVVEAAREDWELREAVRRAARLSRGRVRLELWLWADPGGAETAGSRPARADSQGRTEREATGGTPAGAGGPSFPPYQA